MANASRWSLSARQGFLVVGLVTGGLFVLCCGAGMTSLPIAALGVAVGILGPAVILLSSMRANRADVSGIARVSQVSPAPATGISGRADLHLLVNAQGIHNAVVRLRDPAVPVGKWPDVGATLPVFIPNGNPRRLQVLWDQVHSHRDVTMHAPGYSPYAEEDYLDQTDFARDDDYGYPDTGEVYDVEPVVVEPVVVDPVVIGPVSVAEQAPLVAEQVPLVAEPVPVDDPWRRPASEAEQPVPAGVSPAATMTAAPAGAAAPATAPAPDAAPEAPAQPRRRPSPRPRRAPAEPDSVEAVVPMPVGVPPVGPATGPATGPPPDGAAQPDVPAEVPPSADLPPAEAPPAEAPPAEATATVAEPIAEAPPAEAPAVAPPAEPPPAEAPATVAEPIAEAPPAEALPAEASAVAPPAEPTATTTAGDAAATTTAHDVGTASPATGTPPPEAQLTEARPTDAQPTDAETADAETADAELSAAPAPDVAGQPTPADDTSRISVIPTSNAMSESPRSEMDTDISDANPTAPAEPTAPATPTEPLAPATPNGATPPSADPAAGLGPTETPHPTNGTPIIASTGDGIRPHPAPHVPMQPTAAEVSAAEAAEATAAAVPETDTTEADTTEPDTTEPDTTEAAAEAAAEEETETPYIASASYLADRPAETAQGLRGVHNVSVTLIVADLRRSLTFYRDLLGLTEIDTGVGHAILASGNARILLRQVTDSRPVDRRVVHLNLEVDDVHEAYERLRQAGVEFSHPPRVVTQGEQLEQWAATLRDPDGHAVALTHWEIRR